MWCVTIKLVLLLLPRPVSWNMEVWAMCRECARVCVFVLLAVFPSELHMILPDGKSPICVSANNSWPLNAHPPEAPPTHLYSQGHTFPQRFFTSFHPPFSVFESNLPLASLQSAKTQCRISLKQTPWLHRCRCTNVCVCLCTHRGTNMKQMFRWWRFKLSVQRWPSPLTFCLWADYRLTLWKREAKTHGSVSSSLAQVRRMFPFGAPTAHWKVHTMWMSMAVFTDANNKLIIAQLCSYFI